MTAVLLVATLIGLLYGAWRLSRNRRNPDFWEGGLLWLMSDWSAAFASRTAES
jgi:hypothetical protein